MKRVPFVPRPYCDRCDKPILGAPIPIGLKDRCVECFLRPNVLVNAAIRMASEEPPVRQTCGCGCGKPVTSPAIYTLGHNSRTGKRRDVEMKPCRCVCGTEIRTIDAIGRPRKYVRGHSRGRANRANG